jgi:hypothetical protein
MEDIKGFAILMNKILNYLCFFSMAVIEVKTECLSDVH